MSNELNGNKRGKKSAAHFLPIVFAIVLISGMYLGGRLQQSVPFKLNPLHKEDHQKVAKVLEVINQKYVDSINNDVLVRAAIKGILKNLDPHSIYVAAKDFDQANEQLEGNFEGIGIRFFVVNDTIMVVSPITGGPSAALGIRPGDKIIMIEDELAAGVGITDEDVVKKLRGPKGSKVRVSILRARNKSLIDFTITRDKIPLFSIDVSYMIDDKVGFIKLSHFSRSTEVEFTEAMIQLRSAGMERLILDLRRNPGGFLAAATAISDEFIGKDKLVVYTEGRAQPRFEFKATSKGSFETGELVVLIDEGSASASEIVAGAIQDWDRGVIVGRRSFGKGLVQEQFKFADGSALRLTVSRYYTPSGRSIQKPYNDDFDAYYSEAMHRFENGELVDPDSIDFADSLKFITPTGKVVFGGGGIMPDIFVPLDTSRSSAYLKGIVRGSLLTQFIYAYVPNNLEKFEQYNDAADFRNEFIVSKSFMNEFIEYVTNHDLPFDQAGFDISKDVLKILLRANIAQQVWKNEGYYPIMNEIDDGFLKAYEVIQLN